MILFMSFLGQLTHGLLDNLFRTVNRNNLMDVSLSAFLQKHGYLYVGFVWLELLLVGLNLENHIYMSQASK